MADAFVESKLRDGRVTLFVKSGCPYCRNAKDLLKRYNFVPGGLEVCDIAEREDLQESLQRRTGRRTVPHVFFGRHCIGGLSDLESMRWKLPAILRQIGALR
ncbi:GLRX1 protein, partial [Scopus umbretta]|nr:GLRX1 protein [Scopus umbretta]